MSRGRGKTDIAKPALALSWGSNEGMGVTEGAEVP